MAWKLRTGGIGSVRAQGAGASWCRGLRNATTGIDSAEGGGAVASSREALRVRGGSGKEKEMVRVCGGCWLDHGFDPTSKKLHRPITMDGLEGFVPLAGPAGEEVARMPISSPGPG